MIPLIITIAVAIVFLTIFSETASPFWGLFTIAGFVVIAITVIKAFTLNDLADLWNNNKGMVIGSLVIYIFVGMLWSIYKWKLYCKDYYKKGFSTSISVSEHKDKVSAWMMYWPFSFSWYILNDPIVNFYNFLYHKLQGIYNSISESERTKYLKK